MENAQFEALDLASSLLTPKIERGVRNILYYSVWDNFNELLNSIKGPASIDIATGMMGQEVADIPDPPTPPSLPQIER